MTMGYSGAERRRGGPDRRGGDAKVNILLVDDHALFRVGMRQILEREQDFEIVAEAEDSRTAFEAAQAVLPDIILLDLSIPAPGGIETTHAAGIAHFKLGLGGEVVTFAGTFA